MISRRADPQLEPDLARQKKKAPETKFRKPLLLCLATERIALPRINVKSLV